MPTATRGVNVLPAPSWTRSDNDLLPKWLRYIEWHQNYYGEDQIRRLKQAISDQKDVLAEYAGYVKEFGVKIARAKEKIKELKDADQWTDEELAAKYDALIASPHVIGTRIDQFGALVILIDPQIEGPEELELGMYELDIGSLVEGRHQLIAPNDATSLFDALRNHYSYNHTTYGLVARRDVRFAIDRAARDAFRAYDLLPAVNEVVKAVASLRQRYTGWGYQFSKKSATRQQDHAWFGFVADPIRALRRLHAAVQESNLLSIAGYMHIVTINERHRREANDLIRSTRADLRKSEADLKQLEETPKEFVIDVEDAKRSLEFISMIPGVIAIKFDADNIPVVHLRNSFTHEGRRYDLGDFELHFKLNTNDVPTVERTRCPLGGSYTRGWHGGGWFCFGNRSADIIKLFHSGDFSQMVNITVGTMNSVSVGDMPLIGTGFFAEIGMDDVWQRKPRRRSRRKLGALVIQATLEEVPA